MRLIDADVAEKIIRDYADEVGCNRGEYELTNGILKAVCKLEEIPTVEAVPVVHGEWIYNEYYTWECGNCGFHPFKGFIPKEPGFNYCPNCGCDMRSKCGVERYD